MAEGGRAETNELREKEDVGQSAGSNEERKDFNKTRRLFCQLEQKNTQSISNTFPHSKAVDIRQNQGRMVTLISRQSSDNTDKPGTSLEHNKVNKESEVLQMRNRFLTLNTWAIRLSQPHELPDIDSQEALRLLEEYSKQYLTWEEKHKDRILIFGIKTNFNVALKNVEALKGRELKRSTEIVVIGTTSCGKSTIINKLIGEEEIMLSSPGETTPCTAIIQKSTEDRPYFVSPSSDGRVFFDYTEETKWQPFQDRVDALSEDKAYGCIRLYIPDRLVKPDSLIAEEVVLVDTPGLDRSFFLDGEREKKTVTNADALIVAIDMENGLDNERTRKHLYENDFFVKPNVLVVFNKCDRVARRMPRRFDRLVKANIEAITKFLTREGGPYPNEDEAKKSIFFISATEAEVIRPQEDASDPTMGDCFPGLLYDETDGCYSTSAESRHEGFRQFYKSLLSVSTHQKESKKEERMRNAISAKLKDLFDDASKVETELWNVEMKLKDLTSRKKGGSDEDGYKKFVNDFYLIEIPDGATEVSGEEKVRKFLQFCKTEDIGLSVIHAFLKPEGMCLEGSMETLYEKEMKASLEEIIQLQEDSLVNEFSKHLDPLENLHSKFLDEMNDLQQQLNDNVAQHAENCQQRLQEVTEKVDERKRRFQLQAAQREKELEKLLSDTKFRLKDVLGLALQGIERLLNRNLKIKTFRRPREISALKTTYEERKEAHEIQVKEETGHLLQMSQDMTAEAARKNDDERLTAEEMASTLKIKITDLGRKGDEDIETRRKTQRSQHLTVFLCLFSILANYCFENLEARLTQRRDEIKAIRDELKQLSMNMNTRPSSSFSES